MGYQHFYICGEMVQFTHQLQNRTNNQPPPPCLATAIVALYYMFENFLNARYHLLKVGIRPLWLLIEPIAVDGSPFKIAFERPFRPKVCLK
jgi:hypothetical protein